MPYMASLIWQVLFDESMLYNLQYGNMAASEGAALQVRIAQP